MLILNQPSYEKLKFYISIVNVLITQDVCHLNFPDKIYRDSKYLSMYKKILEFMAKRDSIFTTITDETVKALEIEIKDYFVYGKDMTLDPPDLGFNLIELLTQFISDFLAISFISEKEYVELLAVIIKARNNSENAKDRYSKLLNPAATKVSLESIIEEKDKQSIPNEKIISIALNYPFIAALLIFEIARYYVNIPKPKK